MTTTIGFISKSPSPNENLIPYTKKTLKRKFKSVSPKPKPKPKPEIKVEHPPAERWPTGYKPENLAVLPNFIGKKKESIKDRDVPMFNNVVDNLDKLHNIRRTCLLQHINLPCEAIMKIWSRDAFDNVNVTTDMCKDLVYPELVPHNAKDFMLANMKFEKYIESQKARLGRHGWLVVMSREIKPVVDSKDLIEDYFGEKQKIGSSWKIEQQEEIDVDDLELQLIMKKADITFVSRSSSGINSSNSSTSSGKSSRSVSVASSPTPPKTVSP